MTKQGKSSKHISRVNYCASYLKRLGLVDNKPVGVYTITPKGKKIFLEKGDKLTRDDLKALPPDKTCEDKYFIGFFEYEALVGLWT